MSGSLHNNVEQRFVLCYNDDDMPPRVYITAQLPFGVSKKFSAALWRSTFVRFFLVNKYVIQLDLTCWGRGCVPCDSINYQYFAKTYYF